MARSRDSLFDLAVNRASEAQARIAPARGPAELRRALEVWFLRTRFAYRVPFEDVMRALEGRPSGPVHWEGGPSGGWRPGPPSLP